MAFAARQHDDKTWRLCLRKGVTFSHAGEFQIVFSSQARAKACADALNEKFWDHNAKAITKKAYPPEGAAMLELIKEYCL